MAIYNVEIRRGNGLDYNDRVNVATTWSLIDNKPSTFPPSAHTHEYPTTPFRVGNRYFGLAHKLLAAPSEVIIYTGIKFGESYGMPIVNLYGWHYGGGASFNLSISFYMYDNGFHSSRNVISNGVYAPEVYLFTYIKNNIEYVAVGLVTTEVYYLQFGVDVQEELDGLQTNRIEKEGWEIVGYPNVGNIPSAGNSRVELVPYKNRYLPLTGGTITSELVLNADLKLPGIAYTPTLSYDFARIDTSNRVRRSTIADAKSALGIDSLSQLNAKIDNRYEINIPNDYNSLLKISGLKVNANIGVPDGTAFSTVVGIRGWGDSSGGRAHEIAFAESGEMYQHAGLDGTWDVPWGKLLTSRDNVLMFTTTVPTSNLPAGKKGVAILSSDPAVKYNNWIYIIT